MLSSPVSSHSHKPCWWVTFHCQDTCSHCQSRYMQNHHRLKAIKELRSFFLSCSHPLWEVLITWCEYICSGNCHKGVMSERTEYGRSVKIMSLLCGTSILRLLRGIVNSSNHRVMHAIKRLFWEGEVNVLSSWVISQLSLSSSMMEPK